MHSFSTKACHDTEDDLMNVVLIMKSYDKLASLNAVSLYAGNYFRYGPTYINHTAIVESQCQYCQNLKTRKQNAFAKIKYKFFCFPRCSWSCLTTVRNLFKFFPAASSCSITVMHCTVGRFHALKSWSLFHCQLEAESSLLSGC